MIYTLSARLNDKRKVAGDTIHDMKIKAGVKCTCAACSKPKIVLAPIEVADPVKAAPKPVLTLKTSGSPANSSRRRA
jgi:hypothetical protein